MRSNRVDIGCAIGCCLALVASLGACSSTGGTRGGKGQGGGSVASSASTGGGATQSSSASTGGGVNFGCPCALDKDCKPGLTCYPYGQGSLCSTACVDGACPLDATVGCNNKTPPECKQPLTPACSP